VEGLPEPDLSIHAIGLGDDAHALDGRRKNQVALLRRYGLAPTSNVLEIGCGVGWLAYDLAAELDADRGSYTGFDVSPAAIGWLNENLAPRLPNFRFDLVDARNARYRPGDGVRAEDVTFPYADRRFDLVCAFGVFMHIERRGVARYLQEIARVLEIGHAALLSFMAVTPRDEAPRNGSRAYVPVEPGVYTSRPDRTDWSLAYDDRMIREMIEDAHLYVITCEEGAWHGRRQPGGDAVPGADLYVVAPTP
jgi:SAM-dependent methyltransferase